MRMCGCGALPSRILKPGSCEIQNLNRVGVGSLKTLIKVYFRCVISVPPFVTFRPPVPPTFFSDLAFLFSFSANFFFGRVAVLSVFINSLFDEGTEVECVHIQVCLTLCDPMVCSPPGPSVHGILQAIKLEWVAISFSRVTS